MDNTSNLIPILRTDGQTDRWTDRQKIEEWTERQMDRLNLWTGGLIFSIIFICLI